MTNPPRTRTQPSNKQSAPPPKQAQAKETAPQAQPQIPPTAGAGDKAPMVLPEPVTRRGISEAQWRTLKNNLYPGATNDSCLMVWDYCMARKLDPMKKPCHIVPMEVSVKDQDSGAVNKVWRDVVMPGIYEYRTTAMRTGLYMGHGVPDYGPDIEVLGTTAPEWCSMVFYRWNEAAKQRVEFPVVVYFEEICATKWDKEQGKHTANARWRKAGIQMLTKCTEAAGLREAFPDELGGEHTMEELEGRILGDDDRVIQTIQATTHTHGAKEALRARQGMTRPVAPDAAQSISAVETVRAQTPPPSDKADNVSRETSDLPWDSADSAPKTKEQWISAFRTAKTNNELQELWNQCVDVHDAARTEIDVDIESNMHLMKEKFLGD